VPRCRARGVAQVVGCRVGEVPALRDAAYDLVAHQRPAARAFLRVEHENAGGAESGAN